MPRKKKLPSDPLKEWNEKMDAMHKEHMMLQTMISNTMFQSNRLQEKLKDLKDSDPRACKNCEYKNRCPFYEASTPKNGDCLKMPAFVDNRGVKGYIVAKSLLGDNKILNYN